MKGLRPKVQSLGRRVYSLGFMVRVEGKSLRFTLQGLGFWGIMGCEGLRVWVLRVTASGFRVLGFRV